MPMARTLFEKIWDPHVVARRAVQSNWNVFIAANQFPSPTIENQKFMVVHDVGNSVGSRVFDNNLVVRVQREPDYFAGIVTRFRRQQCIIGVKDESTVADYSTTDDPLDVHEFVEIL